MQPVEFSMMIDPTIIGYGALVGLSLGLTGSGGSILAIPLLVYGVGLPMEAALMISLLMVASIALFGAVRQTFAGNVDWMAALLFSLTGMIVSPLVIYFSQNVNETLRLVLFAVLMLLVSWRMGLSLDNRRTEKSLQQTPPSSATRIVLGGAGAGALSGFFGVGGGFIIVPQLTLLFAKPYAQAVGTSLASISFISLSAIAGTLIKGVPIDWILLATFTSGGLIGLLLGSIFVKKIPERQAKQSFAAITAVLALLILLGACRKLDF